MSQPSTVPNAPPSGCPHLQDPAQNAARAGCMLQRTKPRDGPAHQRPRSWILQVLTARKKRSVGEDVKLRFGWRASLVRLRLMQGSGGVETVREYFWWKIYWWPNQICDWNCYWFKSTSNILFFNCQLVIKIIIETLIIQMLILLSA